MQVGSNRGLGLGDGCHLAELDLLGHPCQDGSMICCLLGGQRNEELAIDHEVGATALLLGGLPVHNLDLAELVPLLGLGLLPLATSFLPKPLACSSRDTGR